MTERLRFTKKRKSYINKDGDALELDEQFFKKARRGRPVLPADQRKQQVTMLLDPDIVAYFKQDGKGWKTWLNATLRKALGLG